MSFTGRHFMSGIVVGIGSLFFRYCLTILLMPVFIHHLGATTFGLFAMFSIYTDLVVLLSTGIGTVNINVLTEHKKKVHEAQYFQYLTLGKWIYFISMTLMFMLVLVMNPWFQSVLQIPSSLVPLSQQCFFIFQFTLLLHLFNGYFRSTLIALSQNKEVNFIENGQTLAFIVGLGGLVWLGLDLAGFMVIQLVVTFGQLLVYLFYSLKVEPQLFSKVVPVSWKQLIPLVKTSTYSLLAQVSLVMSYKLDGFIIGAALPVRSIGLYNFASKFPHSISGVIYRSSNSLMSVFANNRIQDEKPRLQAFFLRSSAWINWVVSSLLLVQLVYFEDIVHYFSAEAFTFGETLPVFLTISFSLWLMCIQVPAEKLLFANGHFKYQSITSLIAAVGNVCLSLYLVNILGVLGPVIGSIIAQALQQQGFIIRKALQDLDISLKDYGRSVYLKTMPCLVVSYGGLFFLESWGPWTPFFLVDMTLNALLVLAPLSLLWFLWTATPSEKRYVQEKLNSLKQRGVLQDAP